MDGQRKAVVQLTDELRQRLEDIVRNGHNSAKRIMHARMLLLSDQNHPLGRYTDEQIARQLGVHEKSVARTRRNFVRTCASSTMIPYRLRVLVRVLPERERR